MQELPIPVPDVEAAARPCDGGQAKNLARPCLLLAEVPAHGYELLERPQPLGFDLGDPASVYKTLRWLENDGHVTFEWELLTRGPARRVYAITNDGHEMLQAWNLTLAKNREILGMILGRVTSPSVGPEPAPVAEHAIASTMRRGGSV